MSERALRGTRLVVTSYETDRGIDLAPRQAVEYACEKGHRFEMPFSVEAEIPQEWECKVCGAPALLVDGDGPEEKKTKPARTHWDMLMERRTREELEEVLEERLAVLRSGAMNIAVHPRDSRRKSA
jgi:RNA polymerase-binding protein